MSHYACCKSLSSRVNERGSENKKTHHGGRETSCTWIGVCVGLCEYGRSQTKWGDMNTRRCNGNMSCKQMFERKNKRLCTYVGESANVSMEDVALKL